MKNIVKLGVILLIITAISAGALAFVNQTTKAQVEKLEIKASNETRSEIFKDASDFKEVDKATLKKLKKENDKVLEVYTAMDSSKNIIGHVIKTATSGYAGDVEVTTGISKDGKIAGVLVGNNKETPGLGSKAAEPNFQNQFKKISAEKEIEVVKSGAKDGQVQALTGATITSGAVTDGVNIAANLFSILTEIGGK